MILMLVTLTDVMSSGDIGITYSVSYCACLMVLRELFLKLISYNI
jgi:hypothetical protein